MDKLFGIDISKKADFDDEVEEQKEVVSRKKYATPMQDEVEKVEEPEYNEEPVVPSVKPEQEHKQKPKSVSDDMNVRYADNEQSDSKEIL